MAFCLKGILLLHVLVVTLQPLTGGQVKRSWSNRADTVHKARDILEPTQANFLKRPEQTKRNPSSTFKFVNQSELAKGIDYLKKKYPDVDWSFVTPLPTPSISGKREFESKNSLEQTKKSSFTFLNQSEIAKGLDYLKKKYPDVDWSFVTPLPTLAGKRELEHGKRTFDFVNQSEIAKGFDYLKKKYPDVDWSFVMPASTSSPGRRELEHGNSLRQAKRTFDFLNQSEIAKGFDYLKKKYPDVDWSFVMPASTSSPGKRELEHGNSLRQAKRTFDFLNQSEIAKGFNYLKKKYPDVDWSLVMPASTSSPGRRELKGQIMESKTNSITNKRLLDHQKKSFLDSGSIQQRNDIPRKHHNSEGSSKQKARDDFTSSFEFLDPEEVKKGLEYLLEKHP